MILVSVDGLRATAIGTGVDTEALAYIGDPFNYASAMRMEYGSYGELARVSGCTASG